jgi:hypothetical protein
MKLNEKYIIDLGSLKRKIKLNEKNEDDKTKTIQIQSYDDIFDAIQYLLNMLKKDLLIQDVVTCMMGFENIYKEAKKPA